MRPLETVVSAACGLRANPDPILYLSKINNVLFGTVGNDTGKQSGTEPDALSLESLKSAAIDEVKQDNGSAPEKEGRFRARFRAIMQTGLNARYGNCIPYMPSIVSVNSMTSSDLLFWTSALTKSRGQNQSAQDYQKCKKKKKGGRLVCRCVDRSDTENNFGFSQVKTGIKRAEELETTFMEMAQQDNRRELSTRIEYMEEEVLDLQQVLAYKKEQEKAMLEVLMRVEQEQKVTEDVRISAERDAAAQRYLASVLQIQLLMISELHYQQSNSTFLNKLQASDDHGLSTSSQKTSKIGTKEKHGCVSLTVMKLKVLD
ncbi:rab-GTPase-TBC domain-containing protein [Artemisia annua]|uniref:Rab-GTPase-TBC domain-containing protein n=1 Tax=Artemisia annua TaxID=35608 RepID=A0A2U1LQH6_ARTAN|nr:rab-GTPase-TBC domain-containing protein [Artemisia annua]